MTLKQKWFELKANCKTNLTYGKITLIAFTLI